MRIRLAAIFGLLAFGGCVSSLRWPNQPAPVSYDNPACIPLANHDQVWDGVVDVVGEYFRVEREDPVRQLGDTFTEGRIDTYYKTGATYLEPWDHDSADGYNKLESTLQSIRRRAVVKVIPAQNGGFWVDVAVFKELENVVQPEHATAGSATFRNDSSLTRVFNPDQPTGFNSGWIPQGRDTVLEQRILGQILERFTPEGTPVPVN